MDSEREEGTENGGQARMDRVNGTTPFAEALLTELRGLAEARRPLAALVRSENVKCDVEVFLGVVNRRIFDALGALGGKPIIGSLRHRNDGPPEAIEAIYLNIDGVTVRAQLTARPATPEELATQVRHVGAVYESPDGSRSVV